MGAAKSLYGRNEYLYWYIEKGDHAKIVQHIEKYPEIVDQPMTKDCRTLPLARAAWRGDKKTINILLDHKANINQVSETGETALMLAAKRNRLEILKILVEAGADVNPVSDLGLKAIDYSILAGFYQNAHYLYPLSDKLLKSPEEYKVIAQKFHYRYTDFNIFLNGLRESIAPQYMEDFSTKPKKEFNDPVIDPREGWGQWFKRVGDFKPPPLVERHDLPE
jgi:ankyrin repeat protein